MNRWKEFLDSLNTPGGHIFVLTALFLLLLALVASVAPTLREVMMIFVGALGNEMRGQLSNAPSRRVEVTKTDTTEKEQ